MPIYVVDTIAQYRMRYVIEAKNEVDAQDAVVMIESGNPDDFFEEFSQKYLGETILDHREISMEEFYEMNRHLNDKKDAEYGSPWMGNAMIHKIKY